MAGGAPQFQICAGFSVWLNSCDGVLVNVRTGAVEYVLSHEHREIMADDPFHFGNVTIRSIARQLRMQDCTPAECSTIAARKMLERGGAFWGEWREAEAERQR